jgi:phytoene desaturase
MHTKKAMVIGSGLGGMATAIRLALQGFEVTVFEKNSGPGGKLTAFEQDGFHFDAGPSLFTQPQNIEELFSLADEPIEKYFAYKPVEIACKYFYPDGKTVNAYTNAALFSQELQEQLGEAPGAVESYLKESAKLYHNIGTIFLNHSLHKRKTWLHTSIGRAMTTVKPGYLFQSLHQHNYKHFKSEKTVQLFNRFATYNGSNPYQAPGMLSLIPHLEMNEGTYYPAGGMISITNALYNLAKNKGVEFHFNRPVQRIIHHEGTVRGVVVDNENIHADIVVSNADAYFTYKNLLADSSKAKKILRQERSSSAVIFYWGIDKVFPQLQLHNILFSNDYKKEFDNIFIHKKLFAHPTVYINITSKMEGGQAPEGKENWFVMINVPANTGQDWASEKEQLRNIVIEKINSVTGEDITNHIVTEHTLDPLMIEEQTASYMGSLYGTSSNSKLAAFLRHPNFTSTIKGLYFCGGSVHPGGGIPLCLKSAAIVSGLVAADNKKRRQH